MPFNNSSEHQLHGSDRIFLKVVKNFIHVMRSLSLTYSFFLFRAHQNEQAVQSQSYSSPYTSVIKRNVEAWSNNSGKQSGNYGSPLTENFLYTMTEFVFLISEPVCNI